MNNMASNLVPSLDESLPSNVQIPSDFVVTPEIHEISGKIADGKSLFITGKAGTGKSTLLSYLQKHVLSERHVVLGFTGVSALNVGGQTIHRFFNFKIDVTIDFVRSDDYLPRNRSVMKSLKTIVFDEVSMVRADLMDCVDAALRRFGPQPELPFGGIQILFVGDLYQLPPIVKKSEQFFINSNFDSPYFLSSNALRSLNYELVELTHIFRQKDLEFIEILNAIRFDKANEQQLHKLNARVQPKPEGIKSNLCLTLVTKKQYAIDLNLDELQKIKSKNYLSTAYVSGSIAGDEFPTDLYLNFKESAQIMLVNNDPQMRWVNGTVATITAVSLNNPDQREDYVEIQVPGHLDRYRVRRHTWTVKRPRSSGKSLVYDTVGSFTQFPFILAWAITIHKSQGKTFDNVMIDLAEPTFASGQLYVALSRCRSLQGTFLKSPITLDHIIVDPRISQLQNSKSNQQRSMTR